MLPVNGGIFKEPREAETQTKDKKRWLVSVSKASQPLIRDVQIQGWNATTV